MEFVSAVNAFLAVLLSVTTPPTAGPDSPEEKKDAITIMAEDKSRGAGGEITITVGLPKQLGSFEKIIIERSSSPKTGFDEVGLLMPGDVRYMDSRDIVDGREYYYRARGINADGEILLSEVMGPVISTGRWFKEGSLFTALISGLVTAVTIFFLFWAKSGKSLYIRPIPGLRAIEEAIGRATEMGRPILWCSGVADIRCPGVLASLTVLSWVSEKVAHYGAKITYPVNQALNLTAGQEIVKESYIRAGKAEEYNDDIVYFVSGEQFAYAAAVCGIMERERTAANFFFGSFWSEGLVLFESGAATGAMQIAATDMEHQLPFMVATCDYVIIGEEFYAASAYLSHDLNIKGSLKAQDVIKAVIIFLVLSGLACFTLVKILMTVFLSALEKSSGLTLDSLYEWLNTFRFTDIIGV